jgi:hypothetical protein
MQLYIPEISRALQQHSYTMALENPLGADPHYENTRTKFYEVQPPEYDTLSVVEITPSRSPNKRVYWYAVGLSLAVAAVVGIITGVTLHLLDSQPNGKSKAHNLN